MPAIIKCDLHIHSHFSDGKLSIAEIVDLYGHHGFGAIAITDHLCEERSIIGHFSHRLKYSLSKDSFPNYIHEIQIQSERALKEYGMLLIPGFEITKNSFVNHRSAHMLILGITEFINPEQSVEKILQTAKDLGALTIAAHPFPTGEFEFQTFHLWSKRHCLSKLIDAWEINSRKNISFEVLNSGLPIIASSDFHHYAHFKSWKTKVYAKASTSEIFTAIRNQKIDFFLDKAIL